MRIVIVDDDGFALRVLSVQLANLGFTDVVTCERAEEARVVLDRSVDTVGLVVCDLQMPDVDGIEFVRYLADAGYAGALMLVSGEDSRILHTAAKLSRAHGLDVVGAFRKPVPVESLRQAMDAFASRRPAVRRDATRVYGPDELRRAISSGELTNYYQPKVEIASGAIVGVESLVRWRHPQDGLVFPDQFIGTAEEHGLIDDLTREVLVNALRQTRAWRDAGLALEVAVNISMDNIADLSFPEFVAGALHETGVGAGQLVLEVTESRLTRDARVPMDVLTRLGLKRVRLSIDDFGTGHSSLAQLRDYPFDELKIDRGFVHGACRDASLRAIFEASRRMARDLGMTIVAEGVEDRADWDFLRSCDCDLAQGYFIARPMPGGDIAGWAERWDAPRRALFCG